MASKVLNGVLRPVGMWVVERDGTLTWVVPRFVKVDYPSGGAGATGVQVNLSTYFSRIVDVQCCRVVNTSDGLVRIPPGEWSCGERGSDLFSAGKFVVITGRIQNYTPAGTVASHTHPENSAAIYTQNATTGTTAPAFTGTATSISAAEQSSGTSWNGASLVVLVYGVPI